MRNARHEVMVGAYGTTTGSLDGVTYVYNRLDSWLSLATKDCRAKCMVIQDLFPELPADTISALWSAETGSTLVSLNTLPDSVSSDQGISLVFNIGTLAPFGSPGDSAIISYAYIYDGPDGIDSAFPDLNYLWILRSQLMQQNHYPLTIPLAPAPIPE